MPGHWTEELAADFKTGLEVVARRVMFQVWRAGAAGIHRNTLCQRTDLTPVELRSLQSYFVDPDFAAVASDLFGERMPDQRSSGLRRP